MNDHSKSEPSSPPQIQITDSWEFANPPTYRGSTVFFENYQAMSDENTPYVYGRWGTPSSNNFCNAMALLEHGFGAILTCSGLAAITTVLLATLKSGSHLLIGESSFPAAIKFCDDILSKFGIKIEKFSDTDPSKINEKILPNTTLIYIDFPGNYGANIFDLKKIEKKSKDTIILVDNTWATPLYYNPIKNGADIVVHSTSKYIAGHSDSIMGCIVVAEEILYQKILNKCRILGQYSGADDIHLALRGLKTLELRMKQHYRSALLIADWLSHHPAIEKVFYAALPSDENHTVWLNKFTGAGGVFSFFFNTNFEKFYSDFLNKLKIIKLGWGWGGSDTLASSSIVNFGKYKDRVAIRISIGLENPGTIIIDLESSLKFLD